MIDKMHMAGHVDNWCNTNCDTKNFKELNDVIILTISLRNYYMYMYLHIHCISGWNCEQTRTLMAVTLRQNDSKDESLHIHFF